MIHSRHLRSGGTLVLLFLLFFTALPLRAAEPEPAPAPGDEVLGIWMSNNGKEKFEIFRRGDEYFGRLIWTSYDTLHDATLRDLKNPDPEKRDQSIIGLEILHNFRYKGRGEYVSGHVYDPGSGNSYKCRIRVDGDTAAVRGYILIPLLGRTETAHRIEEEE